MIPKPLYKKIARCFSETCEDVADAASGIFPSKLAKRVTTRFADARTESHDTLMRYCDEFLRAEMTKGTLKEHPHGGYCPSKVEPIVPTKPKERDPVSEEIRHFMASQKSRSYYNPKPD